MAIELRGGEELRVGSLRVRFMRTLRVPEHGGQNPLPPGLGAFPARAVADLPGAPPAWRRVGGLAIPMYRREAMWISLGGRDEDPWALKFAAGGVNVVSGAGWDETIAPGGDQDYLVTPPQPWLDGINAGDGRVRQFVAMPLGEGFTIEGQITGSEDIGGLQMVGYRLPPEARERLRREREQRVVDVVQVMAAPQLADPSGAMGLGAGGWIHQEIEEDPHGPRSWSRRREARLFVHLVDALAWPRVAGEPAPPTPVSAETYRRHGLPWFERYADSDVPASPVLAGVDPVGQIASGRSGAAEDEDRAAPIGSDRIIDLSRPEASDPFVF